MTETNTARPSDVLLRHTRELTDGLPVVILEGL